MEQTSRRSERIYEAQNTPARQDFSRRDTRWERASSTRDWLILIVIAALHTAWMLLVFFLEPGIR